MIVLSVEQALSMSYATLRLVHQGFRVIRVEAVADDGRETPGDPNRYVGQPVAGADRQSYFVGPNVGKEAIALNLKRVEGRELLARLVRELPVDVFCTNLLPARHEALGLDEPRMRRARAEGCAPAKELIWCSLSALGPDRPEVVGYDPVLQAICGYMDITGDPEGPPMLCGVPLVDLKSGDEVYTQILVALLQRERTGQGARIDLSMIQAATSWLQTLLPLLDMGSAPETLKRRGNEHRLFVPVNVFPTAEPGRHLFVALGSDAQWRRLVARPAFSSLDQERYRTNEGRRGHRDELHQAMAEIMRGHQADELSRLLQEASIPNAPIQPIEAVAELPEIAPRLTRTITPTGEVVRLPPPGGETSHLAQVDRELSFAPSYGEHTRAVLAEVGLEAGRLDELEAMGVIASQLGEG